MSKVDVLAEMQNKGDGGTSVNVTEVTAGASNWLPGQTSFRFQLNFVSFLAVGDWL